MWRKVIEDLDPTMSKQVNFTIIPQDYESDLMTQYNYALQL